MTSLLSSGVCTFKQRRNFVLLQIWSLTCPLGFCVAKIKCTPSERPILAALINSLIKSGNMAFNSANSSTIIIKCGSATSILPALYTRIYLSMWSTPAIAKRRFLRSSSALIEIKERLISFPSISVIIPSVCGKFLNWFAIPPPLKSMIRKATS